MPSRFPPRPTLALLAGLMCCQAAAAAPPSLTYLYPAGARRGTTVEVTAGGSFDRWPARAWVSGRGLEAKAAGLKGRLTVAVAPDAVPGTYWIRLYGEAGASAP